MAYFKEILKFYSYGKACDLPQLTYQNNDFDETAVNKSLFKLFYDMPFNSDL